jgi:hypothetical protein
MIVYLIIVKEIDLYYNQQSHPLQSQFSHPQHSSEQQLQFELLLSVVKQQQHQNKHRRRSPHIILVLELIDDANSQFLAVEPLVSSAEFGCFVT